MNYNLLNPYLPNKRQSLFVKPPEKKENALLPKLKNLWVNAKDALTVKTPKVYGDWGEEIKQPKASLVPGLGIVPQKMVTGNPMFQQTNKNLTGASKLAIAGILADMALPETSKVAGELAQGVSLMSKLPGAGIVSKVKNVIGKSNSNNLNDLAKKYKSAEEFVKAHTKKEYRSAHQLSLSDSITADKIDIPSLKEAIRTRNGYLNNYNLSDLKKLEKLKNNPDADIKIFRASPKNELNDGDWITTDKTYANDIKRQNGGKVYEYTVKVKDLRFPKDVETLPSLSMASTFSYSPKTSQLTDIWNKAQGVSEVYKETGSLTTKILKTLEGKSQISRQFISDLANSGSLKQQERELIRDVLASQKGDIINVSKFAEDVKTNLLPLKMKTSATSKHRGIGVETADFTGGKYENISLPSELRGNIADYAEHIYESPIKTSAGNVHFGEYKFSGYFGHTRIEDLKGNTRRVIEVQSDLYQKGRLGEEFKQNYLGTNLEEAKKSFEYQYGREPNHDDIRLIEKNIESNKIIEKNKSKLQQYNDPTAHYRMVREEVKLAAQDGKTKLQFPTGETAMKIEGLGDNINWITPSHLGGRSVGMDDLKIGNELSDGGTSWIITDVLEDGKFKAVPKYEGPLFFENGKVYVENEGIASGKKQRVELNQGIREQFDISGKVDTNNPIYKFYEKDLGKYLTSKYGAKQITDHQGVKWYEINIKPEWAKEPVEAFGFSTAGQIIGAAGVLGAGAIAYPKLKDVLLPKKKSNDDSLFINSISDITEQQSNKSPEILATIPKKISQNKISSQAVSVFEPQDFNLASRILRQENNPLDLNFENNIYSSNQNTDGTYDEGLFQHNSDQITDKNVPTEQRAYTGTQGDINKLFKENYGRNYDVFNPVDNAEATKLWIQNIKERIKNNWGIEPTDEMVMYFYHKGSRNFSLTMQNNLLNKLNNHPYIVNSLDILGD